jgi:hypothetical protein
MKEDKILNNTYNSGDTGHEDFHGVMKIHDMVAGRYNDYNSDNLIEVRLQNSILEDIYDIFETSTYYEKYKPKKKGDKNDILKIYYFFKEALLKFNKYSLIDIFVGVAEFFEINYDTLYGEIGVHDKQLILKELDGKYQLNNIE